MRIRRFTLVAGAGEFPVFSRARYFTRHHGGAYPLDFKAYSKSMDDARDLNGLGYDARASFSSFLSCDHPDQSSSSDDGKRPSGSEA